MLIEVTTNKRTKLFINVYQLILVEKYKKYTHVILANDEEYYLLDDFDEFIKKIENKLF